MKNNSNKRSSDNITKLLVDTDSLICALQSGIYAALQKHRQAGNSVCIWRDNKIVWIPADSIPVVPKRKK
jgi:hypothetical protein